MDHDNMCSVCVCAYTTLPKVTGADVKSYRQLLHMSVNTFASVFKTSRQNVARLERLARPLTEEEFKSTKLVREDKKFDPERDHITLIIDSRNTETR